MSDESDLSDGTGGAGGARRASLTCQTCLTCRTALAMRGGSNEQHRFMLWLIKHTDKFPRHHRYSLGVSLENRLQTILGLLLRAIFRLATRRTPALRCRTARPAAGNMHGRAQAGASECRGCRARTRQTHTRAPFMTRNPPAAASAFHLDKRPTRGIIVTGARHRAARPGISIWNVRYH